MVAGVFGSLLVTTEKIACMYCYHEARGYPMFWFDTSFTHPDMPTLQRAYEIMASNPDVVNRSVDWGALSVNGAFSALFLVVVTTQVSRVLRSVRRPSSPTTTAA